MAAAPAGMDYYDYLMEILETSAELRNTSRGIFSQMAWTAGRTCTGGVVAGHTGAPVGEIIGAGDANDKYNYDSMLSDVKSLADHDKTSLVKEIQKHICDATLKALASFVVSQGGKLIKAIILVLMKVLGA